MYANHKKDVSCGNIILKFLKIILQEHSFHTIRLCLRIFEKNSGNC